MVKKKIFHTREITIILISILLLLFATPSFSTDVGEPLNILSHDYGFFSGDYYAWSTCRGTGETIEIFVENAIWDSSITDTSYALPSNQLTVLEPDGQGGLYIGTSGGLAHFDGTLFTNFSQFFDKNIIDMSLRGNTLWIVGEGGLYKYENGSFSLYFAGEVASPGISNLDSAAVEAGTNGIVWASTLEGLYKVNTSDSTWTAYHSIDTLNSPVSNIISDIEIDGSGNPWLATDKGISYLDTTWKVINSIVNLISDYVYDITLTDNGIWVGTDKGLAFYVDDTTYTNYDRKNSGLTTNTIRKVKLNNSVRWIVTGDGFFRFRESYDWWHYGMDHTNYLEAHTTDTLNSLDIRDIAFIDDDVYLATSWGLTRYNSSDGSWETWRGPYTDATVYADSALVAAVLEAWDERTPGLDTSHYFYNGIAGALGVNPGGDTLGIYEEVTRLFGDVSDVDNNGKVSVFLLDIRDYWDDADEALDGLGDLTFDGLFLTQNLYSDEPTMRMDLLYIDVRRQSQVEVDMALAKTLTKHILYNNDPDEATWVTEGFGMLSEIFTGYVDQSVGFKGFDKLNYPCQNSMLSWESTNPYGDQQFSEMLLLFMAEKYQFDDDGGLGIILNVANNFTEQGINAFNTALANFGTTYTFSDLFFNLGITATIEADLDYKGIEDDHSEYSFAYHTISSVQNYNTIYWGFAGKATGPYLCGLPEWSSRRYGGWTMFKKDMNEFGLLQFNGADDNYFRVALILNPGGFFSDTTSMVYEIPLNQDRETVVAFLDSLNINDIKSYYIFFISDFGDGSGVTQMVFSHDVVSPDIFGGIKVGVAQNPIEEKLIDLYVTSYEPLCKDVGDVAFVDDGGVVSVISATDTTVVPMDKQLEDESNYEFSYDYTYPDSIYLDSTSTHTATASEFYMYHAEYMIPADGDYSISVSGQDVSGNDATSDVTTITVGSVGSAGKTIVHNSGEFSIDFDEGSVHGSHTVVIVPVTETETGMARSLQRSIPPADIGLIGSEAENVSLSQAYKVGPNQLLLNKPVTVRFDFDISTISAEDRPYVGIYEYLNGNWIDLPTRITSDGFMEAETDHLGIFQLQKGNVIIDQTVLPRKYTLHHNYPNPFNPNTKILFDLPEDTNVTIQVYNTLGQLVSVLTKDRQYSAGYHSIIWDGTNRIGNRVSSGLYFYSIKAGHFSATKKMVLVR